MTNNVNQHARTNNYGTQNNKLNSTLLNYPDTCRLGWRLVDDSDYILELAPRALFNNKKNVMRFEFETGTESIYRDVADKWLIDPTTTTIDLTNKIAGIIDNNSSYNNEDEYQVWAFLNDDFVFSGIGVTKKPRIKITYPGSTITKGSTVTLTAQAGNFYCKQFVVGSTCRLHSDKALGTYTGQYEFNYCTVTDIISSSQITVVMDNQTSLGYNITGGTDIYLEQEDRFEPLNSAGAELYPYWSYIGHYTTCDTTMYANYFSPQTDNFLYMTSKQIFSDASSTAVTATIDTAHYIPYWANRVIVHLIIDGPNTNRFAYIQGSCGFTNYRLYVQKGNVANDNVFDISLQPNAKLLVYHNGVGGSGVTIDILGYYISNGNRG